MTSAKITASLGSTSIGVTLKIDPAVLSELTLSPTTVVGGAAASGVVRLAGEAATGGSSVSLSSNLSSATVPASVKVAASASSATFAISTKAVTAQASAKITAKLGTVSVSATLTVAKSDFKFAGVYTGSFYQSDGGGGVGPCSITIAAGGGITGMATNWVSGSASAVTLTGSVTASGAMSVTSTSGNNVDLNTGTAQFASNGNLVCLLTSDSSSGGTNSITVTLNTSGRSLEFAGNYTGTSMHGSEGVTNLTSFTISSSGAVNGASSNGTFTGAMSTSGVLQLTIHNSDGSTSTATGYFGFDASGLLNGIGFVSSESGSETITLTKSYAGIYQIPLDGGGSATLIVEDTGVATGSSNSSSNPFVITGGVSSAGAVMLIATQAGSGTGTETLTGSMSAMTGGFIGSGTITGSGGAGSWTATGVPATGLIFAGKYTITSGNSTLTFSIDSFGYASGSGSGGASGAVVTGGVTATGAIVLLATPTAAGSAAGTATLIGTLTGTSAGFTGSGTITVLDGNSGTWTCTGMG